MRRTAPAPPPPTGAEGLRVVGSGGGGGGAGVPLHPWALRNLPDSEPPLGAQKLTPGSKGSVPPPPPQEGERGCVCVLGAGVSLHSWALGTVPDLGPPPLPELHRDPALVSQL